MKDLTSESSSTHSRLLSPTRIKLKEAFDLPPSTLSTTYTASKQSEVSPNINNNSKAQDEKSVAFPPIKFGIHSSRVAPSREPISRWKSVVQRFIDQNPIAFTRLKDSAIAASSPAQPTISSVTPAIPPVKPASSSAKAPSSAAHVVTLAAHDLVLSPQGVSSPAASLSSSAASVSSSAKAVSSSAKALSSAAHDVGSSAKIVSQSARVSLVKERFQPSKTLLDVVGKLRPSSTSSDASFGLHRKLPTEFYSISNRLSTERTKSSKTRFKLLIWETYRHHFSLVSSQFV